MVKVIHTVCEEGICPVCGGKVEYTDSSRDCVSWFCPHCHASGDEGADYVADLEEMVFDGHHYNVVDGNGNPVAILNPDASAIHSTKRNPVYVIQVERNFTSEAETSLIVADFDYDRAKRNMETVFDNEKYALEHFPVRKNCYVSDCTVQKGKDLYEVARCEYENTECGCSYANRQTSVVKLIEVDVSDPIPTASETPTGYTVNQTPVQNGEDEAAQNDPHAITTEHKKEDIFLCPYCGNVLDPVQTAMDPDNPRRWKFCPDCGNPIPWQEITPVIPGDYNCKVCGCWLGTVRADGSSYASSHYNGTEICDDCQMEHCLATNCLACKIGKYPDCQFLDMKRNYLED